MIPFTGDLCHESLVHTISDPYVDPEDRCASPHAIHEEMGSPEKPGDLPHAMELAGVRAGILIQALGQRHSQVIG